MSTWADIKKLAVQLKTTQESESANFLSDRTCVDIVSYLISTRRLKIIRTIDGRSLLTLKELDQEILEELEVHGGRVSLLELSSSLDVELSIIETRVQELISKIADDSESANYVLISGDLLTRGFIRRLAEEMRDRFELRGVINVIELSRIFNFSPQFIANIISEYNGNMFNIHKDSEKYYTDSYLNKQKAKVVGYFSGVVTPISLASVSSKLDIPLKLLTSLLDSLISGSRLHGSFTASRSVYSPSCFTNAQNEYIKSFYSQNGYVEWSLVKRLGINDPSSYLHSQLLNAIHTKEFSVSEGVLSQIKGLISDYTEESAWIDVTNYLPPNFGPKEREWLIAPLIKSTNLVSLNEYTFLCSKDCLNRYCATFDDFVREKAVAFAKTKRQITSNKSPSPSQSIYDSNSAKTSSKKGKSGGFGAGAREIKTKNVKKKYLKKNEAQDAVDLDLDDSSISFDEYLPRDQLIIILANHLGQEAPDNIIDAVLDFILPELQYKFAQLTKSIFLQTSDTSKNRDRFMAEKESLISSIIYIQLLERGALTVDDPNLRLQLLRQLIRGDVTTFVNRLLLLTAIAYDIEWPNEPSMVLTMNKNSRKKQAALIDDVCDKVEETKIDDSLPATNHGAIADPDKISLPQRESLFQFLDRLSAEGPAKEAADLIQQLNILLRPNAEVLELSENSSPLNEIFNLCDALAASHLGVNLSISILRSSKIDSKRKRQEKALVLELASKTEQKLLEACESAITNPDLSTLANVALAAVSLFGCCIIGWPIPVYGKIVPSLSFWVQNKLSDKSTDQKSPFPAAVRELQKSNSGDNLILLKNLVAMLARKDESVSSDVIVSLLRTVSEAANSCRKAMVSGTS